MEHHVLDLVTALWLGLVGACVGSFLNVVAYRMPRGMSVVWKPSHCPRCGHAIRARDNVPVLGWLLLGGRCRDCREPISPR
jgi:leader peptidase (prepilin peptidase)/N-methyltransferase